MQQHIRATKTTFDLLLDPAIIWDDAAIEEYKVNIEKWGMQRIAILLPYYMKERSLKRQDATFATGYPSPLWAESAYVLTAVR